MAYIDLTPVLNSTENTEHTLIIDILQSLGIVASGTLMKTCIPKFKLVKLDNRVCFIIPLSATLTKDGPRQTNLVLIAYASSDGSGIRAVSLEPPLLSHTSSESREPSDRKPYPWPL